MLSASRRTVFAVAIVTLAGLGLCSLSSCGQNQSDPVVLVNTGKPALHAVSSVELRRAMTELKRQTSQNLRMQLYVGDAAAVDMAKVAEAAASMATTAADIPQAVPGLKLDKAEEQMFLNLVGKMKDEANTLKAQADRNDRAAVNATMNRLMATCNACHSSFRLAPVSD